MIDPDRRWAAVAAVGTAVFYLVVAGTSPDAVGTWQDDAIYLATAKSLAEGTGYRHLEIPGEPLQTKYPILYPALLSLAWWAAPSHPENRWLLLAPSALAAAGAVWLSILYLRRVMGLGAGLTWLLWPLLALTPSLLSLVRFPMSEFPYALLSLGALLLLDGDDGRGPRRAAWAGVLIGAAVLTRSIGISLAFAALVGLVLRRRYRDAAALAAIVTALLLPWLAYQGWAAAANGALQNDWMVAPELRYGLWLPEAPGSSLTVAIQNPLRAALGLGYLQFGLPERFVLGALSGDGWPLFALHALVGLLCLAVAAGFGSCFRAGRPTFLQLYALAYGGLVLLWPFDPMRFLVPFTPFLLAWLLLGCSVAVRRSVAAARSLAAARRIPIEMGAIGAVLLALFAWDASQILASDDDSFHFREGEVDLLERRAVTEWIEANTSADAVVASAEPAALFLSTGRQGHYFWPDNDPYALYYGKDRSAASFFIAPAPSEARHVAEEIRARFPEEWERAGIDWFVETVGLNESAHVLGALARENPGRFDLRFATPGQRYRVYRFRRVDP